MSSFRVVAPALLLLFAAIPAGAASFDCAAAKTPFEHAICDMPDLSHADEVMAKSFATATGGLSEASISTMRDGQRNWLDYAQRACTTDAKPLAKGKYDEEGGACLLDLFKSRSTVLEQSRMLGGHRFLVESHYDAMPDPNEVDSDQSYWKVANHELAYPLLDSVDELATDFNAYITARAKTLTQLDGGGDESLDPSSDTSVSVDVKNVVSANRITLEATSYWYGHGAAHGDYTIEYLHYYIPENREVVASDIFAGTGWEKTLTDLAWEQLQIQHKEWLQIESSNDISQIVIDPTRWDLSDDYGLVIQFEPYEVAAYAYGAPTVTIPWDKLDAIKAQTQEAVRYGS